MKKILFGLILLSGPALAQVSVYSCDAYDDPTQAEILNSNGQFYRGCVDLSDPGDYTLQQNFAQEIKASTNIHVTDVFHAGPYTGNANTHMVLGATSPFDVAVMNGVKLDNLLRYDKLELGVMLPEPYRTKLENFILKQENPLVPMLPEDRINPFLEWELDVEAEFTRSGLGTVQKVEAFFTVDQVRNYTTLLWDDIPSDYHMRVRFAPPENGAWTAKIRIKVNEVLVSESASFPLLVVESGKHGYISIHPNRTNFELDGEVIFPVGQNFPHPDNAQNLDPSVTGVPNPYNLYEGKTEFANNINGWQDYIDLIDGYGDLGGKFTRIFMAPHAGLVEWEEKGNYYRRMHQAYEMDKVIEVHESQNMFTMFDLLLHNYFMTWGDYNQWSWDWDHHLYCADLDPNPPHLPIPCGSGADQVQPGERYYPNANIHPWELNHPIHPYNDNPGNYLDPAQDPKMPHDMFLDTNDIKYHEQRIRYYISRYGYSTAIYMWEQMDEIFHMDEDGFATSEEEQTATYQNPSDEFYAQSHDAVNNYVRRMNKFIREDMGHKHQLLALNCAELEVENQPNYSHDLSMLDPNGDCLSRSYYRINPDALIVDSHDDPDDNLEYFSDENSTAYRDIMRYRSIYWDANDKSIPMVFGECGADGNFYLDHMSCQQGTGEIIDNMRFGFLGIAGFNKWHYFQSNQHGVHESIIRAQNHMNGQDVKDVIGSMGYQQGRQYEEITTGTLDEDEGDAVEMQYYITQDRSLAVGYVYNRTVNYKTASGGNCHPDPQGFDKNNFDEIQWFDFTDAATSEKLKLDDLPSDSEYDVDYYNHPAGDYAFTQSASVGLFDEDFELEYPELNSGRALVWFVAHRLGNKKNMEFFDEDSANLALSLIIYPNPSTGIMYVPKSLENISIQNAVGQCQMVKILREERDFFVLDVESYSSGIYFIISSSLAEPMKFVKL